MIHHEIEQNTPEWQELRIGKFTASAFKDLFASKTTAAYNNLIKKIAFEKITGEAPENFQSDYMARGHELEPFAREKYEEYTFTEVKNGGFFEFNEWIGCSPDGIVGDGIVEIKCPSYSTMLDYLCNPKLPSIYIAQVQGQLWITGAKWCDFVCFHPKLPFMCQRIERDEIFIKSLEDKVNTAIEEAKIIIEKVKQFKNK